MSLTKEYSDVSPDSLWSHVGRGPHHGLGHQGGRLPVPVATEPHQTKISDLWFVVRVQQNVGSFYISEDDSQSGRDDKSLSHLWTRGLL